MACTDNIRNLSRWDRADNSNEVACSNGEKLPDANAIPDNEWVLDMFK